MKNLTAITLSLALVCAGFAIAGPLSPPAGPVTSTYKTLSEVEPRIALSAANTPGTATSVFQITQPGSYYLMGNVTAPTAKWAIEVAADDVTVDLGGFKITGDATTGGVRAIGGARSRIAVRHGAIAYIGGGIDFHNGVASVSCRVEDVSISHTAGDGLRAGAEAIVLRCSASDCGGMGIVTDANARIDVCSAFRDTFFGINADLHSAISGCTAGQNQGVGIAGGSGAVISACTASENTGAGFSAGFSTIVDCSSSYNSGAGFTSTANATIQRCTATQNGGDGIQADHGCLIQNNNCAANGLNLAAGAGIHFTGANNRIEGNLCTNSPRGIKCDSYGSILLRNTCMSNGIAFDVAASNHVFIVLAPSNASAISGVSGGTQLSTDPNANFAY